MNSNQSILIGKLAAASRLPETGDFRRDALLGGFISTMNPLAGTVIDVRTADKITDLTKQVDSLKTANNRANGDKTVLEDIVLEANKLAEAGDLRALPPLLKKASDAIVATRK